MEKGNDKEISGRSRDDGGSAGFFDATDARSLPCGIGQVGQWLSSGVSEASARQHLTAYSIIITCSHHMSHSSSTIINPPSAERFSRSVPSHDSQLLRYASHPCQILQIMSNSPLRQQPAYPHPRRRFASQHILSLSTSYSSRR